MSCSLIPGFLGQALEKTQSLLGFFVCSFFACFSFVCLFLFVYSHLNHKLSPSLQFLFFFFSNFLWGPFFPIGPNASGMESPRLSNQVRAKYTRKGTSWWDSDSIVTSAIPDGQGEFFQFLVKYKYL